MIGINLLEQATKVSFKYELCHILVSCADCLKETLSAFL